MKARKGKIEGPEFMRRLAARRRVRLLRGDAEIPKPLRTSGTEDVTVRLSAVNVWKTNSEKPMRFASWRAGTAHVEATCFDEQLFPALDRAAHGLPRKPITLRIRYGKGGHIKILAVLTPEVAA